MKNKEKIVKITLGIAILVLILGNAKAVPDAYIPNSGSNTVSIIDTSNDNRIYTMYFTGNGPWGVAVHPSGTKVYITNSNNGSVMVINTTTRKTKYINVQNHPVGIAINSKGTRAYVANGGSNSVSVINTISDTVITNITIGPYPGGIAVDPAGNKVYVTNGVASGTISVIDAITNSFEETIPVGRWPAAVAVNPAGTEVWVTNNGDRSVSRFVISNHTVLTPIQNVGDNPYGIRFNSAGTKIYVTNWYLSCCNYVSVINLNPFNITRITTGSGTTGVDINPDGTKLYVVNHNSNNISVIDTSTNKVIASPNVDNAPISLGKFIVPIPINCNTSKIYGYSFNDSNGNKTKDPGEAGLPRTINLIGIDTCRRTLVGESISTNSTGYYSFNVDPGVYLVSQDFVLGWLPTTDAAYTLRVPSISTSIRKDFGNKKS